MRLSSARTGAPARTTSPRRLRSITVLLASLSALAGVAGCNPFSQQATTTDATVIKVGVVPGIDNATLYLAKKRGYFSSAGINVQIVDFKTVDA
ncbi:MAG: hypothetical protein ACTHKL_13880, partial [Streptosporangiaceae bacterium]